MNTTGLITNTPLKVRNGWSEDRPHAKPKPLAPEGRLVSSPLNGKDARALLPRTHSLGLLPCCSIQSQGTWVADLGAAGTEGGWEWGGGKPPFPSELPGDQAEGCQS